MTALQYDLVGTHNAVTYTVSLEPGVTEGVLMGDSDAIVLPESFHTGTSPSSGGGGGGDNRGVWRRRVIVLPSVSDEDAKKAFPQGWETPKPYIRVV